MMNAVGVSSCLGGGDFYQARSRKLETGLAVPNVDNGDQESPVQDDQMTVSSWRGIGRRAWRGCNPGTRPRVGAALVSHVANIKTCQRNMTHGAATPGGLSQPLRGAEHDARAGGPFASPSPDRDRSVLASLARASARRTGILRRVDCIAMSREDPRRFLRIGHSGKRKYAVPDSTMV